jgi:hypothetical protein
MDGVGNEEKESGSKKWDRKNKLWVGREEEFVGRGRIIDWGYGEEEDEGKRHESDYEILRFWYSGSERGRVGGGRNMWARRKGEGGM